MYECKIPDKLLYDICTRIEEKFENIPFKERNKDNKKINSRYIGNT